MSVKPIPEGYTSLTPFLCIYGASAAIDFYVSVFGAVEAVSPEERDRRMAEWAKENVDS